MNKKKPLLIAFDMDGTLLNNKKKISLKTLFLLRKLTRQGHKIVLASGRPSRALRTYYKQLHLNTPMICYNGTYTFSPSDKSFKEKALVFPKETILEITNKIGKYILNLMCEDDTNIWCDKKDDYLNRFFWFNNMNVQYGDLNKILDRGVMTCIMHLPNDLTEKQKDEIKKVVSKYKGLCCRFWIGSPYFELGFEEASKGSALCYIADYYKIPRERVIAFGDAPNDLEMFDFAGTSVAMKNAKCEMKNATMVSVKDNNHDGIYYTLKKILNA